MQAEFATMSNFNPRAQIDPCGNILALQGAGVIAPQGLFPPYDGRTTGWLGSRPESGDRTKAA